MELNNLCDTLIVYGSYAPNGVNNTLFDDLPGEWKKGKILAKVLSSIDDIATGEDIVEAWIFTFSDCQAEMFTPEWEVEKQRLHERWTALDEAMGSDWARTQQRWWPEASVALTPKDDIIVVNIYVPVKNYPYLANQISPPSPEESNDVIGMWNKVKSGEKKYDDSNFMGFINDLLPDQYEALFADLPKGDEFIAKLNSFFNSSTSSNNSLTQQKEGEFNLYVQPAKQSIGDNEILALVEAEIEQHAAYLKWANFEEEAKTLSNLKYELATPQTCTDTKAADALDEASDYISDDCELDHHWQYCLNEACYSIACSFALRHWLMSQWYNYDFDFDFSLAYKIWNSGYDYEIHGKTCFVFKT